MIFVCLGDACGFVFQSSQVTMAMFVWHCRRSCKCVFKLTPAGACMQVAFLLQEKPNPLSNIVLVNISHQIPLSRAIDVSVHPTC